MHKILVEFPDKRNVSFQFGKGEREMKVIVRPHIATYERIELIQTYLSAYFKHSTEQFDELSTSAIFAEGVFEIALVDMLTNVKSLDRDDEEGDSEDIIPTVRLDDLHSSGLLDKIKGKIVDLDVLIGMRERVLRDAMQERFSFKGIIDMITDAVNSLDVEKIGELQKEFQGLQKTIKDSPLAGLMKEAS